MARILTGIQSTGVPHLGNILGAVVPAIEQAKQEEDESFLFIADLHSLTQIKDPQQLKENTYKVAAAWLAMGLDPEKTVFYRQSDLPEVTELSWYLSCFFPFQRLKLAHSFKDKVDHLDEVNSGLFSYPILMAADILLYQAEVVPIGKDQQQHIEFTRDVASRFNSKMGTVFTIPEPSLKEETQYIPGVDGKKMSKSYKNTIDIFAEQTVLKKQVMSIVTDNIPLEAPKNPDNCTVYKLYSLVASSDEVQRMAASYKQGNYGYGHAKKELSACLLKTYEQARKQYQIYLNDTEQIEAILKKGVQKARKVANVTLASVRNHLGY